MQALAKAHVPDKGVMGGQFELHKIKEDVKIGVLMSLM